MSEQRCYTFYIAACLGRPTLLMSDILHLPKLKLYYIPLLNHILQRQATTQLNSNIVIYVNALETLLSLNPAED